MHQKTDIPEAYPTLPAIVSSKADTYTINSYYKSSEIVEDNEPAEESTPFLSTTTIQSTNNSLLAYSNSRIINSQIQDDEQMARELQRQFTTSATTAQSSTMTAPPMTQLATSSSATTLGVEVDQRVALEGVGGSGGVKYVCCGECRQWLSAPNEATYVFCPGCKSVNNCNLVSANNSVRKILTVTLLYQVYIIISNL